MKIKKIFFISLLLTLFIACTNAPISGRKQLLLVSEEDMINQSYSQYREIIVHSKVLNNSDAKLVKKYAFVSVENYQIVATGDSVAQAEQAYYALLEANGKKTDSSEYKTNELTGAITAINEAVVDGNSTYYFKLEGSDTIFIGDISLSNQFPLAKVGDVVTIEYVNSKDNSEVITSIKFG